MKNLRDSLEKKYLIKTNERHPIEQIASEVLSFFKADKNYYFDVTGFAKDFYLAPFLTQVEKEQFYNELKKGSFFEQLIAYLYTDNFSACSWSIYVIGKFSDTENAKYLEEAYETNFSLTNPILSYRCLLELSWLSSNKTDQYLADLQLDNSITSKLVLLYSWEPDSDSSKLKTLIKDKELINFIDPNRTLVNPEEEVYSRLFAFEMHVTELYNSATEKIITKPDFESIAKNYFYSNYRIRW